MTPWPRPVQIHMKKESSTNTLKLLALMALASNLCCAQPAPVAPDQGWHWVGAWGAAPQLTEPKNLPPPPGLRGGTLRQIVHVSMGGKKLRARFSNVFGADPVTIRSAHAALSAGGSAIRTDSDRVLKFQDHAFTTIPPGESIYSDPFDFELAPLSNLAVTIHFDNVPDAITGHPGARTTSYLQTGSLVSAEDLPAAVRIQHWYFLTGIDVEAERSGAAIIILGDSITDGRGSGTDVLPGDAGAPVAADGELGKHCGAE